MTRSRVFIISYCNRHTLSRSGLLKFGFLKLSSTHWYDGNYAHVDLQNTLLTDIAAITNEIALRRILHDLTKYESTLIRVTCWCSQATSDYSHLYWQSSMSLYGVNELHLKTWYDHVWSLTDAVSEYWIYGIICGVVAIFSLHSNFGLDVDRSLFMLFLKPLSPVHLDEHVASTL